MRLLLTLLLTVSVYAATIRGSVVDSGNAGVSGATVRLLEASSRNLVLRSQTKDDGTLALNVDKPGKYAVAVTHPGFQEKLILFTVAAANVDLPELVLGFRGCDSPGVNCDMMCSGPDQAACSWPPPPRTKDLPLRANCTVDADSLDPWCDNPPVHSRKADFRLRVTSTECWLEAINGAHLAEPQAPDEPCGKAFIKVRIDELGLGTQYCLTTNGGHKSRIYLLDAVPHDAKIIRIHLVTWP